MALAIRIWSVVLYVDLITQDTNLWSRDWPPSSSDTVLPHIAYMLLLKLMPDHTNFHRTYAKKIRILLISYPYLYIIINLDASFLHNNRCIHAQFISDFFSSPSQTYSCLLFGDKISSISIVSWFDDVWRNPSLFRVSYKDLEGLIPLISYSQKIILVSLQPRLCGDLILICTGVMTWLWWACSYWLLLAYLCLPSARNYCRKEAILKN